MALVTQLQFCLNNSCSELIVSETTGAYSLSNTGGYGTPNATTGDIETYLLLITDPSGTVYTIDLFDTGFFPTTDSTVEYSIPMASLGNRSVIEDGYWQFSWSALYAGPTHATGNSASYFTCNSECCVKALLAKIDLTDDCCCSGDASDVADYLKAKVLLEGLKNAAFCGNLSIFTNIQSSLTRICQKTNCRTCN